MTPQRTPTTTGGSCVKPPSGSASCSRCSPAVPGATAGGMRGRLGGLQGPRRETLSGAGVPGRGSRGLDGGRGLSLRSRLRRRSPSDRTVRSHRPASWGTPSLAPCVSFCSPICNSCGSDAPDLAPIPPLSLWETSPISFPLETALPSPRDTGGASKTKPGPGEALKVNFISDSRFPFS